MKGWLIYDRDGAGRNKAFIDFWFSAAKKRGVELELHITDSPLPQKNPDFAVIRTMDTALSYSLENRGVHVFNPASVSEVCNNKWKTYCLAESLGIPFPKTRYVADPAKMENIQYPFVLKACGGHGGTQVFMVTNRDEMLIAVDALRGIPCVIQEHVSDLGKDLRVYVLGKTVLAAMLRTSKNDFRSNFCLGGSAVPYQLCSEELAIVNAFCDALPFGLAGIDLMFHQGKPVFNEIEDVVGCRMLYSRTDIDPVSLYMDYILQNLSK